MIRHRVRPRVSDYVVGAGTAVRAPRPAASGVRRRPESGDTLIEVLLALVVLGMASVAILIALSTTIGASAEHRKLATYDNVLAVASQQLTSLIQAQPTFFTDACTTPITSYPDGGGSSLLALPTPYSGQYSVQLTSVAWWNGTTYSTTCAANVPQLITIELLVNGSLSSPLMTNSFVVDYSVGSASAVAATGTPDHLAFLNTVAGGYAGSPLGTQPVVAVENGANQIVTTDLSMVTLSLSPTLVTNGLSNCSGNEVLGVVTFSGCTIGTGGTFQLVASDGTLTPATSNSFTVSSSSYHLVFTSQPIAGRSGANFGQSPVVAVENGSGSIDSSWQGTITLQSSGGLLSNCGLAAGLTTPTSATLTVVNGKATLPSGCLFAGGYFYDSAASPPTTATHYTMSAVATPTAVGDSAVSTTSNTFSVTGPGTASQLVFTTEPTGVASGNPSATFTGQPAVTIEDSYGNVVYNISSPPPVTLQLTQGGSAIANYPKGCQYAVSYGVYQFSNCYGNAYGVGYQLVASGSGLSSATSTPFNITNVATTLSFTTPPVASASGTQFSQQPVLTVTDSSGRTVTSITTPIASYGASPASGTLTNCTSLVPSLGVYHLATCTFAGLVGTSYTMSATVPGLPTAVSTSFSPTQPGVATQLVFTTAPVATTSGAPLATQPIVSVEDSAGNVVTSASTPITLTASGGTLSSCSGLTAAAGVVNVSNCTFAGVVKTTYTLTASSPGLTSATDPLVLTYPGVASQVVLSGCSADIVSLTSCTATATIEDVYNNVETTDSTSVVTFAQSSGAGTLTFAGSGAATVSGGVATETVTGANIGQVVVTASADGFTSNSVSFTVEPIPQTITWSGWPTTPPTWVPGGAGTFSAGTATDTANSVVTFNSSTPSVCTVSGTTVTMLNAGTCTIVPTATASGNYALTVGTPQSIVIGKAAQTVSFTTKGGAPATNDATTYSPSGTYQTYAIGSGGGAVTFAISASSSPSGVCTVNSSTGLVAINSAGTCLVTADAAATSNYLDSGVSSPPFRLTINKANQSPLTLASTTVPYTGTYSTTLAASGGSGMGAVTFAVSSGGTASGCSVSGSTLTASSFGTCLVTATKAADTDYLVTSSSPATITFTNQSVAFYTSSSYNTVTTGASISYNPSSPTYQTYAKGSGGGTVTFAISASSSPSGVCTVGASSGLVTLTSVGTCVVTADAGPIGSYLDSGPTSFTLVALGQPRWDGTSTATNGTNGKTTVTLSQPTTTKVGDLLIAVLYSGDNYQYGGGDPGTVTAPTGWTSVPCATSGGGCTTNNFNFNTGTSDQNGAVVTFTMKATAVATSKNPITYTFNSNNSGNFDLVSALLLSYGTPDGTTPVVDQSYWNPSQTTKKLTPTTNSDTFLTVIGDWWANSLSVDRGSALTARGSVVDGGVSSSLAADELLSSASPVPSMTPVSQSGSGQGVSVTILLKY